MAKTKKEEMVTIKIERRTKDQPDEIVWINNDRYQIQPGVKVQVPESVAAVLEDREYMRQKAYEAEEAARFVEP